MFNVVQCLIVPYEFSNLKRSLKNKWRWPYIGVIWLSVTCRPTGEKVLLMLRSKTYKSVYILYVNIPNMTTRIKECSVLFNMCLGYLFILYEF